VRRVLVPVSLESPCQGPQSKTPLPALNRRRDSDNGVVAILSWGAIGSLEASTTHPGGVRFPGAPLTTFLF
jgi:hypothetical protein